VGPGGPDTVEAQSLLARAKEARRAAEAALGLTHKSLDSRATDADLAEAVRRHPNLTDLRLNHCREIRNLSVLERLPKLKELDILGCDGVADLSVLGRLPALEGLTPSGKFGQRDLAALARGSPKLRRLDLEWAPAVTDLAPLAGLKELAELSLPPGAGDADLTRVADDHPDLAKLSLRLNKRLADFSPLSRMRGLRSLTPPAGTGAQLRAATGRCPQISELVVVSGRELGGMGFLENLPMLRALCLSCSPDLDDLAPLAVKAPGLTSLRLVQCNRVWNLRPLTGLKNLRDLNIQFCDGLSDISPVGEMKGLKLFMLYGCKEVGGEQLEAVRRALPGCQIGGNR
jgi:hypothetical protein